MNVNIIYNGLSVNDIAKMTSVPRSTIYAVNRLVERQNVQFEFGKRDDNIFWFYSICTTLNLRKRYDLPIMYSNSVTSNQLLVGLMIL
jgi:hypothetical protein